MKKTLIVLLFTFVAVSCQTENTYQTIKIKKQYSMELPAFLEKTTELNTEASLQYQNVFKELYVIVIDEPKQGFINTMAKQKSGITADFNGFSDIALENLKASLTNFDFSGIENIIVNGLEARSFSISGTVEGIDVYYKAAHIATATDFYQVLTWTLVDKKEKYDAEMNKIIASFKSLKSRSRSAS